MGILERIAEIESEVKGIVLSVIMVLSHNGLTKNDNKIKDRMFI